MKRLRIALMVLVGCLGGLMVFLLMASQQSGADRTRVPIEAQQHLQRGRNLFEAKCQRCHSLSHHNHLTRLRERVPSAKWLVGFIRNAPALIQANDPYANKLYLENSKVEMPAFRELSDRDIAEIVLYIEHQEGE